MPTPNIPTEARAPQDNELGLFDVQILVEASLQFLKVRSEETVKQEKRMRALKANNKPVTLIEPDYIGTLHRSKHTGVQDMAEALETQQFITANILLIATKRTLVKKRGVSEKLAEKAVNTLTNLKGIQKVQGCDRWNDIKTTALTTMRTQLEKTVPSYLAEMDSEGRAYSEDDKKVDGEDLGVLTVWDRAGRQNENKRIVLYTADRYLGLAAPHAGTQTEATKQPHWAIWYENVPGEGWNAHLTFNVNPEFMNTILENKKRDIKLKHNPKQTVTAVHINR